MRVAVSTDIQAKPAKVWSIISDIENAADTITGIDAIEVLEEPKGKSLVGLKWKETRTFAGRQATEVMWITESKANLYYQTLAESHGSMYVLRMEIAPTADGCTLTMRFDGTPQTAGAKIMWPLTGWLMKGAMRKACAKDLADIQAAAEG